MGEFPGAPVSVLGDAPALSVVIPFYNEEPNVPGLLEEVRAALDPLGISYEVVAVNDGSRDQTGDVLHRLAASWESLRVEDFSRNRGQAAALWHGFEVARAPWIATLDGDGQNPPGELPRLWALRGTADMLVGARQNRQDSRLRRLMSRVANAVRRRLLRDGVSDSGCALKLFRRETCRSFLPIRTLYSFIPAFAASGGWIVAEVPVAHRPRRAGVSNYGLRVMAITPLLDMVSLWWVLRRAMPLARHARDGTTAANGSRRVDGARADGR